MKHHERFRSITIEGKPFASATWVDVDGQAIDPDQCIGFHRHVFTKSTFSWNRIKHPDETKVIIVDGHDTSSFVVKHGSDEDVESLVFAHQVLVGPQMKTVQINDAMANEIEITRMLTTVPVLVLQMISSHDKIRIRLKKDHKQQEYWVTKGTRLFEVCTPRAHHVLVDHTGKALPWDLPCYQHIIAQDIEVDDEYSEVEPSPTQPFEITVPEQGTEALCTADLSINALIQQNMHQIQQRLQQMLDVPVSGAITMFLQDRLITLCQRGPAVGDDEMRFFLWKLRQDHDIHTHGIYQWNDEQHVWQRDTADTNAPSNQPWIKGVAVVCMHQHWIPLFASPESGNQVFYYCAKPMADDTLADLGNCIWGPRLLSFVHIQADEIYGWCGFQAMQWMTLMMNVMIQRTDDVQHSELLGMLQKALSSSVMENYERTMVPPKGGLDQTFVNTCRDAFVRQQFESPSQPVYHGMGDKEPMNKLRALGKIAAVMIGRNHTQEEAMEVATRITDSNLVLAKSIASQKDNKAYGLILEHCAKHSIQLQHTKAEAAQRLQQWFRRKYAPKNTKKAETSNRVDLHQLAIPEKSFMIRNGEYVSVQKTWSPAIRGIAVSSRAEVDKFLQAGKMISAEANAAIILEDVKTTGEIETSRVTTAAIDMKGNKAIMNVTIINFGERKIIRVPTKDATVETVDATVLSVQLYQNQVKPEDWTAIQGSPAKMILQQLQSDKTKMQVVSLWSRRWTEDLQTWLVLSGMTTIPIYLSQKRNQEEPEQNTSHRVIWVAKNLADTQANIGRLSNHCGIVHKAPNQFGIRVKEQHFAASWTKIKGEEAKVPSQVSTKYRYIIDGLPQAINGQALESWGTEINWSLRVLRKFSSNRYLVGTASPKPEGELSLNGKQVLILDHNEQLRGKHPIVAGKLAFQPAQTRGEDTLQANDPWGGAHPGPQKQTTTSNDPWSGWQPTTGTTPVNEGQNQRINMLEQEMKVLKESFQQNQAEQRNKFAELERDITAVSSDLKSSMHSALQEQSQTLIKTFETLLSKGSKSLPAERSRSPGRGGTSK
eukprot:Skav229071  [mRNA]  locus=scaffold2781:90929:94087:- [translate_table: standard]